MHFHRMRRTLFRGLGYYVSHAFHMLHHLVTFFVTYSPIGMLIGTPSDYQGSAVSGPSLWRMFIVFWGSRSSGDVLPLRQQ
ncbi:hypothetical protein KI387_035917, partial [Taxus chinensis]